MPPNIWSGKKKCMLSYFSQKWSTAGNIAEFHTLTEPETLTITTGKDRDKSLHIYYAT